ncbi:MAG: cation diffusion facilitator family transporter [Chloroflexota bacterium]|jgi:cation diffusion facilitator family transporter|nr:cation diffusion facilitator family transporter [Chloroflexota bacterium]
MINATRPSLARFAWLAIAAAVITISLKLAAYVLTGSVGFFSDALESVVNLVAAVIALIALIIAQRDPDDEHAYGHDKAEYFSSGLEGALILLAAGIIIYSALPRLIHPEDLAQLGWGVALSVVASLVNLAVARVLFSAARSYNSITLEADGRHLMTDVWTSVGVIAGVVTVGITGWDRLDSILALFVAANIIWAGISLVRRSMLGLLDTGLPENEVAIVTDILQRFEQTHPIHTHAVRTRQAASRRFVSMHVLVPGTWTVEHGHNVIEQMEVEIRKSLARTTIFTHLEPAENPISWADMELDRDDSKPAHPGK